MRVEPPHKFAEAIRHEISQGYGFVPLVGSGLSAPSGIPTGEQFGDYLCYCVAMVLAGEWNPQDLKWRDFHEGKPDRKWIKAKIGELKPELPRSKDERLTWQAVGALADWRASLQLLSRLRFLPKDEARPEPEVYLGAPNDLVTDSFFVHITRGREPSVSHLMLAHLADALRLRTILTTNFDSLIEEAFARLGVSLTTFDVHQKAGLPDARLVLGQRSIVKLHGGRYGLRADFTLDEDPSQEDCRDFIGYLAGVPLGEGDLGTGVPTRNHLLVMGLSGSDQRTLKLIGAARKAAPQLQVFWVLYHKTGLTGKEEVEAELPEGIRGWDRVTVVSHWNLDLLLFELYQRLLLSLPPAGAKYPAFWRVPPHPYRFKDNEKASKEYRAFQANSATLVSDITNMFEAGAMERQVLVYDGPSGLSSVAAEAYDRLCPKYHCVWLELDDFCSVSDMFVTLVECVARCCGMPSTMPVTSAGEMPDRATELRDLMKRSDRSFVVFLCGRDGPGANAGWQSDWDGQRTTEFWTFLGEVRSVAVATFVVLTRSLRCMSAADRKAFAGSEFCPPPDESNVFACTTFDRKCISYRNKQIVENVGRWLGLGRSPRGEANEQQRFVYAMTLFRHSRHRAALCSWALRKAPGRLRLDGGDNDQERDLQGREWLTKLDELGVIRRKPGGFVWMHRDIKRDLRKALESSIPSLLAIQTECHQGIADWYDKLFRSCDDPLAALESVYHRIECIRHAEKSTNAFAGCGSPDHIRRTSLVEAIGILKLARDRILSYAYFTAPTNLLNGIAQECTQLLRQGVVMTTEHRYLCGCLRTLCLELQRDFASEVASFALALDRNKEVGELLKSEAVSPPQIRESGQSSGLLTLIHRQGQFQGGLRSYGVSAKTFGDFFCKIGLSVPSFPVSDDAVPQAREDARRWLAEPRRDPHVLQEAITALRRFMFLEMLIAQIEGLLGRYRRRADRLMRAETLWCQATELMRGVDDPHFLQVENGHIRTLCSVLLANMRRYREAHRRLNEACGYFSQACTPPDAVEWAVVDLRRAEIYIRQADEQNRTDRRALFDDAFMILERAERRLTSRSTNLWWWSWMYELRLTLCSTIARDMGCGRPNAYGSRRSDRPLVCLGCVGVEDQCCRIFGKAAGLIQKDPLRQARIAALILDLVKRAPSGEGREVLKQAKSGLKRLLKARRTAAFAWDDRIRKYSDRVVKQAEAVLATPVRHGRRRAAGLLTRRA